MERRLIKWESGSGRGLGPSTTMGGGRGLGRAQQWEGVEARVRCNSKGGSGVRARGKLDGKRVLERDSRKGGGRARGLEHDGGKGRGLGRNSGRELRAKGCNCPKAGTNRRNYVRVNGHYDVRARWKGSGAKAKGRNRLEVNGRSGRRANGAQAQGGKGLRRRGTT